MSDFNNTNITFSLKGLYNKKFNQDKTLSQENIEIINRIHEDITEKKFDNFVAYNKIVEYGLFDEEYYLAQCEFKPEIDSLLHYIYFGHLRNLNPCEIFDTRFYRTFNKNIEEGDNPLVYLVNKGIYEGIIKVNKDLWQPQAINKFKLDDKIEQFDSYGLNCDYRDEQIIVSLTSYPKRIFEVKYSIYSLLNQNLKPDKIILWLAKDEFPNRECDLPVELKNFLKRGLTIKWCDSIKSYKKLLPSLREYSESIIVTADDDLYYPKDWLEKLYKHHQKYPLDIVTHRSRKISFENGIIDKYLKWKVSENEEDASFLNFFTTGGGTLFPPNSLSNTIFQTDIYDRVCPTCDDIWFWAMAVLNNTKIRVVKDNIYDIIYVSPARDILFNKDTLWSYNEHHNDEQLEEILQEFPEINIRITDEYYKE